MPCMHAPTRAGTGMLHLTPLPCSVRTWHHAAATRLHVALSNSDRAGHVDCHSARAGAVLGRQARADCHEQVALPGGRVRVGVEVLAAAGLRAVHDVLTRRLDQLQPKAAHRWQRDQHGFMCSSPELVQSDEEAKDLHFGSMGSLLVMPSKAAGPLRGLLLQC